MPNILLANSGTHHKYINILVHMQITECTATKLVFKSDLPVVRHRKRLITTPDTSLPPARGYTRPASLFIALVRSSMAGFVLLCLSHDLYSSKCYSYINSIRGVSLSFHIA